MKRRGREKGRPSRSERSTDDDNDNDEAILVSGRRNPPADDVVHSTLVATEEGGDVDGDGGYENVHDLEGTTTTVPPRPNGDGGAPGGTPESSQGLSNSDPQRAPESETEADGSGTTIEGETGADASENPLEGAGANPSETPIDEAMANGSETPLEEAVANAEAPIEGYIVQPKPSRPEPELVPARLYVDPNRCTPMGWLGVTVLIVGLVVAIIVGATLIARRNQGEDNATDFPSLAPTVEPIPLDPLQVLEPIFGDISAMEDGSYGKMAFEWVTSIANNNTYSRGLLDDWRTQEWQIIQRYGVVYLYFATNGPEWTEQLNFLSDAHECEWNQIIETWFNEAYEALPMDERGSNAKAGVASCDEESRVTRLVVPFNGLGNWIPYKVIVDTLPKLQALDLINAYIDPDTGFDTFDISEGIGFPSEIGQLTDLESLILQNHGFSGTLPSDVWLNLTKLKYLVVNGNYITGTIPTDLGALTSLQLLNLNLNLLTGPLPSELGWLRNIQRIHLDSNFLTGTLPSSYGAWGESIELVELHENLLTGRLPESYGNWTNIQWFILMTNGLTGTLPNSYGAWGESIGAISFSNNQLTGPLPKSYENWTNIAYLYLFDNSLTGILPPSYGAWGGSIQKFRLSSNQLEGRLPESYANWTNIVHLYLFDNNLTGTLPSAYGDWGTTLEQAFFQNNQLVGTFPPAYGSWTNVQSVNFSLNCLEGTIPASYRSMNLAPTLMSTVTIQGIFGPQYNASADGRCNKD
jgi:hypothetical protein